MPKDRPDFITVRLSDHALETLGMDATVTATTGNMHYSFHGMAAVEVLRYPEWQYLQHDSIEGGLLFQPAAATESTSSEA